ncbi:MAG: NAD(P)H-dependent flavin oxidoreductase [Gammaproteobacteria bacterium]
MPLSRMLADLRLPILQAPMFLVSSLSLAGACCRAGIAGAFQLANPRTIGELEQWLDAISALERDCRARGERFAPYAVNVNANAIEQAGYREKFDLCERARVPLVVSSIGDPAALVARVHAWGGRVIHDVTTLRFAEKAAAAGVDGLMLTCAGAGGHTGALSPFAFLPQVRRFFDGALVLAGGIAEAAGIRAALTLGADLVCMGTRFIATAESVAPEDYKRMLVASATGDVIETDAIAGLTANWLRPSIVANGLDPDRLPPPAGRHRPDLPAGVRAWKTVWSAGHSVGLIDDIPSVGSLADRLERDLAGVLAPDWRTRLAARLRADAA